MDTYTERRSAKHPPLTNQYSGSRRTERGTLKFFASVPVRGSSQTHLCSTQMACSIQPRRAGDATDTGPCSALISVLHRLSPSCDPAVLSVRAHKFLAKG